MLALTKEARQTCRLYHLIRRQLGGARNPTNAFQNITSRRVCGSRGPALRPSRPQSFVRSRRAEWRPSFDDAGGRAMKIARKCGSPRAAPQQRGVAGAGNERGRGSLIMRDGSRVPIQLAENRERRGKAHYSVSVQLQHGCCRYTKGPCSETNRQAVASFSSA